ncbi:MAG TPA: hypothetical protein PKE58_23235 [Acidobacteriota bacterium]|nr:hypothetical protein [Acidobacteriota bacterium]
MKKILVIHTNQEHRQETIEFLGETIEIERIGSEGDPEKVQELISQFDGKVDAIALEGMPAILELGSARRPHSKGTALAKAATQTPVVDGHGVRSGLERWGVILANRAQPGIFSYKRILMFPGLNHTGLAHALGRNGSEIRYGDPIMFFNLPALPGVGAKYTLEQAAPTTRRLARARVSVNAKHFAFRPRRQSQAMIVLSGLLVHPGHSRLPLPGRP